MYVIADVRAYNKTKNKTSTNLMYMTNTGSMLLIKTTGKITDTYINCTPNRFLFFSPGNTKIEE